MIKDFRTSTSGIVFQDIDCWKTYININGRPTNHLMTKLAGEHNIEVSDVNLAANVIVAKSSAEDMTDAEHAFADFSGAWHRDTVFYSDQQYDLFKAYTIHKVARDHTDSERVRHASQRAMDRLAALMPYIGISAQEADHWGVDTGEYDKILSEQQSLIKQQ
jgi:hypothetical protein